MEIDLLLAAITHTLQKTKVDKLALIVDNNGVVITDLIDLTFHKDQKIGFRAAWILEQVYIQRQNDFLLAVPYFLEKFKMQNNLSARRHFAKILALLTHKNAPRPIKDLVDNYDVDELIAITFNWLIDEKVPVAIKSHCLNILANFTVRQQWIKEELLQTINFLVDKESIGFYAKVKQIKKQLAKT